MYAKQRTPKLQFKKITSSDSGCNSRYKCVFGKWCCSSQHKVSCYLGAPSPPLGKVSDSGDEVKGHLVSHVGVMLVVRVGVNKLPNPCSSGQQFTCRTKDISCVVRPACSYWSPWGQWFLSTTANQAAGRLRRNSAIETKRSYRTLQGDSCLNSGTSQSMALTTCVAAASLVKNITQHTCCLHGDELQDLPNVRPCGIIGPRNTVYVPLH